MGAGDEGRPKLASAIVNGSRLKYLGLTLMLAWHYCLWFESAAFPGVFLLDDRITFAWLIALSSTAVTLALLAAVLGRGRHLSPQKVWIWPTSTLASLATASLTLWAVRVPNPAWAYAASAAIGVCGGFLWVLWGERHACQRSRFTMSRIAPTYGGFMLLLLAVEFCLPGKAAPAFVALLPLTSGLLLHISWKRAPDRGYPHLLPKGLARSALTSVMTVCVITFVASFASYFIVAIIPWEDLGDIDQSFTFGIVLGALFVISTNLLRHLPVGHDSVFRLFPWLLFLSVVACALYLLPMPVNSLSFLLALAVSSVMEVLLVMYMGGLTLRGYLPPVLAFSLSGGAIRLGICLGNGTALMYERLASDQDAWAIPTDLALIIVLTALLIPLVRQEYTINEVVRSPQTMSEMEIMVAQVATEFALSERERQIVCLIARGYTAAAVAEKLVISISTVNTHIQHIYGKIGIHKRAELLNYLHKNE